MEFQFLFMVDVPERPVGNQELELEGRFGWNFSSCSWSKFLTSRSGTRTGTYIGGHSNSCSWSRFLSRRSGTRNRNWRADLDGNSVPVCGPGSSIACRDPGTGTGDHIWIEFQFLLVVKVPEPPAGSQELELEGRFGSNFSSSSSMMVPQPLVGDQELELKDRFGWIFSSCLCSKLPSDRSGNRNWNRRADLDVISVLFVVGTKI